MTSVMAEMQQDSAREKPSRPPDSEVPEAARPWPPRSTPQEWPWRFEQVLLVRHVETEWNAVGRRQGHLDSPLTKKGTAQAETLARLMRGRGIDRIYSSPLGRARQTAKPVAAQLRLPVTVLDDLAELDHGTLAGLTNSEIEERHPGELARREEQKYEWRFPAGESYSDADLRAGRALRRIDGDGAARPLLVTHEMLARMIIGHLMGIPVEEALKWNLSHGEAVEFATGRTFLRHSAS